MRSGIIVVITIALALAASGCVSNTSAPKVGAQGYTQQMLDAEIARQNKRATDRNQVVHADLELGSLYLMKGDGAESSEHLLAADGEIEKMDAKPPEELTEGLASTFVSQELKAYRGHDYDRIMMNTYLGLLRLREGKLDEARTEFVRAYDHQQTAVQRNAKRIDEAAKSVDKNEKASKTTQDPGFQAELKKEYGNLDQYGAYGPYVNPFSEWMQGVYYLTVGSSADAERARIALDRVAKMVPNNTYVQEDYKLAESRSNLGPLPAITYVVFETGIAPTREKTTIRVPIFTGRSLSHVKVAFPKLNFSNNYANVLHVTAGGATADTQIVCNMDDVVATDFKHELDEEIIPKTVMGTIAKTAGSIAASEAASRSGNAYVALGGLVGSALIQETLGAPDLRTWSHLPKQFQVARVPTPADGIVRVEAGGSLQTVEVRPNFVNLIWVKSMASRSPLFVSQITLRGATVTPEAPAPEADKPAPTPAPATPAPEAK